MNARFTKDVFVTPEGREKMKDLVLTYFDLGGMQLQINVIEPFVNGQTCTTAAPEQLRHCGGLDLFSEGGTVHCTSLDIWTVEPARAG